MTRRDVLMTGAAALGAMAMAPEASAAVTSPAAGAGAGEHGMLHVFVFHWKPQATEADKQRAIKEIRAFQGVVPGLVSVRVGQNLSPKNKEYSFGGVMQFTDKASYEAYPTHPAHAALLKWLVPLIDPIELDLPA